MHATWAERSRSFWTRVARLAALAAWCGLAACAHAPPFDLASIGQARVLVLGEQHDQPDHQRQAAAIVQGLVAKGQLAALVLEMADQGRSTAGLPREASEDQVRAALGWTGWPWRVYADLVMGAVRAGVPVQGGNLPRAKLRETMADATIDPRIDPNVRERVLQAVREGHCGALPPAREPAMLRVQFSRDATMAATVAAALTSAGPGQRVVLHTGMQHASRDRGVPWHLVHDGSLSATEVHVVAFGGLTQEAGLVVDQDRPAQRTPRPDPCEGLAQRLAAPVPPAAASPAR